MMTEEFDNFLSSYIYQGSTSHLGFFLIWQQDEINVINEWRFQTSFRETDIKFAQRKNKQQTKL